MALRHAVPAMPFTLAHPAAVLPLRGLRVLSFAGLVVGAMTPDFGYYLLQQDIQLETHSLEGSLLTCLPVGLVLALLFDRLKLPLCRLLPQPHRGALLPQAAVRRPWTLPALLALAASVLFGIWSHLLWDSFTHISYWGPRHIALLRREIWYGSDGSVMHLSDLLQWLSSFFGLAVLGLAYGRWLRRQPAVAADAAEERKRWRWLLGIAAAAVLAAAPLAWHIAAPYHSLHVYAFQAWVHAASFFLLLATALALLRGRPGETA
jgi:hypothetical protein